jgi:glycerate-2-kinase
MSAGRRQAIIDIYQRALAQVAPEAIVPAQLERRGPELRIGERVQPLPALGVYMLALGKAAVPMISAAESALGDCVQGGIAVTKDAEPELPAATVLLGSHPVPDERSLAAGEAMLAFARRIPPGAIAICLISGGGSALAEALRPGVTLAQMRDITSELLRAGASIHELNAVRSRLSAFKAGGLLAALSQAQVFNLIISDVLGDDPATIASGPTIPPRVGLRAEDVLARYGVTAQLPPPVDLELPEPHTHIIANISTALDGAADASSRMGYQPLILARALEGEARDVVGTLAGIAAEAARAHSDPRPPLCLLAGGETTVTVRGHGRGGRNTEGALAAALRIEGLPYVAIGCLATDGDDGVTGAAGGIVDGATIQPDNRNAARRALDANDSFTFLNGAGAAWGQGPSGTNVNDLFIALIDSAGYGEGAA